MSSSTNGKAVPGSSQSDLAAAGPALMDSVPTEPEPVDPALIERAAQRLRAGALVAFPTETVYGLGADAGSEAAVAAIYSAKGRPRDHPLIVHVSGWMAAQYWIASDRDAYDRASRLARAFWPGPLSMVVPRRADAPAWACGGQSSVGLRCPSHPVAQALLRRFEALGGKGVAAPSANRFGRISPTRAEHVRDELAAADLLVLDGGASQVGLESTIVDLTRATPVLLRPGAVSAQQIGAVLGQPVTESGNIANPDRVDEQAPRVSGSLASHYAPATALQLAPTNAFEQTLAAAQARGKCVATLRLDGEDAGRYAQMLYARLRALDAQRADLILVESPPEEPQWAAVRDRLLRARTR